ncbi:hypothetical protein CXB51_001637 [Gossypium anomalum]|uniref:Aminotransferase-like plant mobile domain-containing protein n=1 Tax=Gossypium anomalum TaxID=47600 RepID=A0A8J5ZB54_9ROSI|nr:hypothetical protein CXB51_001637 [Gossypium anomalum]
MATSLICFDDKHIFTAQAIMVDDCVLEGFIYNMGKPAIPKICGHLQQVGFLHASRMIRGCKLNLTLINVLVERWRRETHTFHLPCSECTITLKDVALQLSLLVDGSIITGSAVVLGKVDLCRALLGKVSDKFEGGWISTNWLGNNFDKLPKDRTKGVIEQYTPSIHYEVNWGHFNARKVSNFGALVDLVTTIVSTAQSDQLIHVPVGDEIRWRQRISPPPRDLNELHKVDIRGKNNDNWPQWHGEHIEAWERRMQSLPSRESFFSIDMVADVEYLPWFRLVGKSYLLSSEEWRSQIRLHISLHRRPTHTLPPADPNAGTDTGAALDADADAHATLNVDADAHATLDVDADT